MNDRRDFIAMLATMSARLKYPLGLGALASDPAVCPADVSQNGGPESNLSADSGSTLFFKSSKVPNQLDTWIYFHEGTFYAYYLTGPFLRWDGVGVATSRDGVHWQDCGRVIEMASGKNWLGSGSIWRSGDTFIMNFSESRGTWPERGATHHGHQTIFFAESTDLIRWTRLDSKYKFKPDAQWYMPDGRWDCIWPVARSGGGFYGYWTATPKDGLTGIGFGESPDGRSWKALPPAKLGGHEAHSEVGAVWVRNGRYYALVTGSAGSKTDTLVADSPQGPFEPATKNRGLLVANASYFPRFLDVPDGVLVNHHSWETGPLQTQPGRIYMAPLKRAVWDDEGTLRLKWWSGNEVAKRARITLASTLAETAFDPTRCLILEGVMSLDWVWSDPIQAPGFYVQGANGRGTAMLAYSNSSVVFGDSQPDGTYFEQKGSVSRELPAEKTARFRFLRKGRMTEFYLNDYLMQCYCLPDLGTGRIDSIGNANVTNVRAWYCDQGFPVER